MRKQIYILSAFTLFATAFIFSALDSYAADSVNSSEKDKKEESKKVSPPSSKDKKKDGKKQDDKKTSDSKVVVKPPIKTINAKGEVRERRCFRDNNKDSICDNSEKGSGKCKNNCTVYKEDDNKDKNKKKKTTTSSSSPCENCPMAGNCAGCLGLA